MLDENSLSMDIEFSVRETTCRRGSGEDPATCDFQRGYYVVSGLGRAQGPPTADPETNTRKHLIFSRDLELRGWPAGRWVLGHCVGSGHTGRQAPWSWVGWCGPVLRTWALESVVLMDPGGLFNPLGLSFLFSKVGIVRVPSTVNTKRSKIPQAFQVGLKMVSKR